MTKQEKSALATAISAHAGQHRLDGKPFVSHPIRVYEYLRAQECPEYVCIAGLLHDVVEDGGIQPETIKRLYPEDISDLVLGMSVRSTRYGSEDKDTYYLRFAEAIKTDQWLIILKLADRFDNLCDMDSFDEARIQRNIDDTMNRLIPLVDAQAMTSEQARVALDLCENIKIIIQSYS